MVRFSEMTPNERVGDKTYNGSTPAISHAHWLLLSWLKPTMQLTLEIIMLIVQRARTIKYVIVLGMVLLGYDYLLTFDRELSLIWASRWNLGKLLFLLVRYTPYIDVCLMAFYMTRDGTSPSACSISYQVNSWVFVIGVGLAEILLTLRTWACWGRARWITIALPIAFFALAATICVSVGLYHRSLYLVFAPPHTTPSLGCLYSGDSFALVICWAALMVYDACIALLMTIRGYPALRDYWNHGNNKTLSTIIYRDGLIYYVFLFGLSLVNLVVILCLPYDYVNLLSTFERVMYAILTCRALLDIREQNEVDVRSLGFHHDSVSRPVHALRFAVPTA